MKRSVCGHTCWFLHRQCECTEPQAVSVTVSESVRVSVNEPLMWGWLLDPYTKLLLISLASKSQGFMVALQRCKSGLLNHRLSPPPLPPISWGFATWKTIFPRESFLLFERDFWQIYLVGSRSCSLHASSLEFTNETNSWRVFSRGGTRDETKVPQL